MLFEQLIEIIDPEPHSAALNMALDEALLQHAELPTLRTYRWREPAVSFGYFGQYAEAEKAAAGREMVRRWTGGGLVEHGEDLTYTLIVPRHAAFFRHSALESYRLIHEQIARWLAGRGLAAQVAPASAEGTSPACFSRHVRYDVVAGNAKVAGAAQRRTRWGLLHQGSIQTPPLARGIFPEHLAASFARQVRPAHIAAETHGIAEQIARDKYATREWLRKF